MNRRVARRAAAMVGGATLVLLLSVVHGGAPPTVVRGAPAFGLKSGPAPDFQVIYGPRIEQWTFVAQTGNGARRLLCDDNQACDWNDFVREAQAGSKCVWSGRIWWADLPHGALVGGDGPLFATAVEGTASLDLHAGKPGGPAVQGSNTSREQLHLQVGTIPVWWRLLGYHDTLSFEAPCHLTWFTLIGHFEGRSYGFLGGEIWNTYTDFELVPGGWRIEFPAYW